jgi:NADH:ubiquinone oxidoreductase subunit 6 (subunit J)|uniref:NADH-quinone oxidoreductase subunit J n=1 Tax=Desulfobacca acetoxidans TaxID=60893 RepID=A0A7V6DQ25_9BACT
MNLGFLSPQGLATGAFLLVVGLTLLGALIAVGARNIFHNVLGLALALIGVAGIFLYLNSPFVALMQILIYVGAICIAICFAIMLSQPLYLPGPPRSFLKLLGAMLGSGAVFAFLALLTRKSKWVPALERSKDWSITTLGHYLLTEYVLIFEVISLLLLVAMLGAVVTARDGRGS